MPRSTPRTPKRMNEAALAAAALFYLSRYASSSGNLRRVLARKAARSAQFHGDDPAAFAPIIDRIVAYHVQNGAVNDALYAESQIRSLRRRGGSGRVIGQRLMAKGIPADVIADNTPELKDAAEDRAAAILFARRRRLGPFRQSGRAENRQRDMAALGRAGFDYQIAASIVDAADVETLGDLMANT